MATEVLLGPSSSVQLAGSYLAAGNLNYEVRCTGMGRLVGLVKGTPGTVGYPRVVQSNQDGTVSFTTALTVNADGNYPIDLLLTMPYATLQLDAGGSGATLTFTAELLPGTGGSSSGGGGGGSSPDYSAYRSGVAASDTASATTPATGAARVVSATERTYVDLRYVQAGDQATILVAFYTAAGSGFVGGYVLSPQAGPATDSGGKYAAEVVSVPTLAPYADVRVLQIGAGALDVYLWGL